jgi:Protein of unknown function (DUF3892)
MTATPEPQWLLAEADGLRRALVEPGVLDEESAAAVESLARDGPADEVARILVAAAGRMHPDVLGYGVFAPIRSWFASDHFEVIVALSRYGNKYLKTVADGDAPNNLLALPESRSSDGRIPRPRRGRARRPERGGET